MAGANQDRESVAAATRRELRQLKALSTVEGRIALTLAKALDDRAGIQAGGLASSAKRLDELMDKIRAKAAPAATDSVGEAQDSVERVFRVVG